MRIATACATATFMTTAAVLLAAGCHSSQPDRIGHSAHSREVTARVKPNDFDRLLGGTWRGTLTYLDYTSNKPTTIRSTLRVTAKEPGVWLFATGYDDEPHADGASQVHTEQNGAMIRNDDTFERVVSRVERSGTTEIITQFEGEDNKLKATIRRQYTIGDGSFSIRKCVKTEGQSDFFERHAYSWNR